MQSFPFAVQNEPAFSPVGNQTALSALFYEPALNRTIFQGFDGWDAAAGGGGG